MVFSGLFKRFSTLCRPNARIQAYPFPYVPRRALSDSKLFNNGDSSVLPVLIVGAGPVGLVLSILLTKLGLKGLDREAFEARQILIGHECVSINTSDDVVSVTASFLKDGKHMERNIKCKMVVGTDGAGSTVRKLAGIDMRGEKDLQKLVSVHFLSRDLGNYLLSQRPGMLFFIFNTEAIGVLVVMGVALYTKYYQKILIPD